MMKRRLIWPTVICLLIFGLLADHLYLSQSRWSVVVFLSRIASIITAIFGPALNPTLYGWLEPFVFPGILMLLGVMAIWLTVAWAKGAMVKATANIEDVVSLSLPRSIPISQPAKVAKPIVSTPLSQPRKFRLAWKLTVCFGSVAFTFGALVSIIAYSRLADAVEKEIKRHAALSVMGLSEVAKSDGVNQSETELRRVIDRHVSNSSIAYIYVEDGEGKIIAHIPRDLPRFLRRDFPGTSLQAVKGVETEYRGQPVFEIASRMRDPNGGYAHLAIWRELIAAETLRILIPVMASFLVVIGGIIALFSRMVSSMTRPLVELVHYANRIDNGELDLDLVISEESDELRDIANSFARLRSSLYAVMIRLKELH